MAERIKVFIRIRPGVDNDQLSADELLPNFEYNTEKNQFRLKKKIYTIDGILPPPSQQTDVYNKVATNRIDAFVQGFNTTIFAYGQTGSGKTHTIFGPDLTNTISSTSAVSNIKSLFGMVPRCFITVFEALKNSNHISKYQMDLSCVEVYNTTLRDLFKPSNSKNLKIREDPKLKHFFVEHLTEETIQTSEELMLFIKRIQLNRAVSSTNMNQTSSRSHVLLQLRVIQQLLTGETKESLLTFVDLAGSEMVKKSGTKGDTLKEAGYINSSLSTLSRVIEGLGLQHSNKNKVGHSHIPFRDSSLTKLLKNALGGNCKTTLIVCVSSQLSHKEETHSSLRFATRAACIKNEPVINKALDAQALYEENIRLKAEIERLQTINSGAQNEWFQDKLNELESKEQEIVELKEMIEELQLKLDKITNQRKKNVSEFEENNVRLSQQINELEIELMREKHCKDTMQEQLIDLKVIYSEVASQKLFDDYSDVEMEAYKRCSSVDEPPDKDMTKKVILDAIKFRRSMKEVLNPNNPNNHNQQLREILMQFLPEDSDKPNYYNNINPMYLIKVCQAMNDKIQSLEIELQSKDLNDIEQQYNQETLSLFRSNSRNIIQLNVTDISCIDNDEEHQSVLPASTYDTKSTIDSSITHYNSIPSNEMKNTSKPSNEIQTLQSYHIYKNDSGTEVSFEPLSFEDEQVLEDKDVEIQIEEKIEQEIEQKKDIISRLETMASVHSHHIECHVQTQTVQSVCNAQTQTNRCHDNNDDNNDDIESVPVVDAGCSILRIFKCSS